MPACACGLGLLKLPLLFSIFYFLFPVVCVLFGSHDYDGHDRAWNSTARHGMRQGVQSDRAVSIKNWRTAKLSMGEYRRGDRLSTNGQLSNDPV